MISIKNVSKSYDKKNKIKAARKDKNVRIIYLIFSPFNLSYI